MVLAVVVTAMFVYDIIVKTGELPFFALIVPFWLVWAMAGRKATFEVWPAGSASRS